MTTLVSLPSRHINAKYILLLTDYKRLRTINDDRDVVVNAGHLIVNVEYLIPDTAYFIIDSMRGFQNLCSYHPDLFICQFVQSRQRIFYLSLSNQLLQVFF
jgi:hypothetical protein